MWVTKREWARHMRELRAALDRAKTAEELLASERQSKDWMITQLTSRFVTKQGGYGLDHEPPKAMPKSHPKGFVREPDDTDTARLNYYVKCYQEAGKSDDEAQQAATQLWEAEMRGESVTYEYETEQ